MRFVTIVALALLCVIGAQAQTAMQHSVSLPAPGSHYFSAVINTTVIFAGGAESASSGDCNLHVMAFDVLRNETTPTYANLTTARCSMATAVAGNQVYFFGGLVSYGNTIDSIDVFMLPDLDYVNYTTGLSQARMFQNYRTQAPGGFSFPSAVAPGGRAASSTAHYTTVDVFNAATQARTEDDLSAPGRANFGIASVTVNGKMLTVVTGGSTSSIFSPYYTDKVEYYDHSTNIWTEITPGLSATRGGVAAVGCGKYVAAIGGYDTGNDGGIGDYSTADIFDMSLSPPARISTVTLSMVRSEAAAACLGPYIYVAGGQSGCSSCYTDSVEVIDTRDWTVWSADPLPLSMAGVSGAGVPGFGALFAGGSTGSVYTEKITYYTCGNGIVEAWEVCDTSANCDKNCSSCEAGFEPFQGFCLPPGATEVPFTPTPTPIEPTPEPSPVPTPEPSPVSSPESSPESSPVPSPLPTDETPSTVVSSSISTVVSSSSQASTPTPVPPVPPAASVLLCYEGFSSPVANVSCESYQDRCIAYESELAIFTSTAYLCGTQANCDSYRNSSTVTNIICCSTDNCNSPAALMANDGAAAYLAPLAILAAIALMLA